MPPTKGNMLQYSEKAMDDAIDDARRGMPVATAAKTHNVPRSTLWNKLKGKTPLKRQMGREAYLSSDHESTLVEWIKQVAKAGFPVSKDQLLDSVRKLVIELEIETPFKNNRPGKRWYKSFLRRHPDISSRICQNLTSTRASVTKEQLDNWFDEIFSYLQINGYDQILQDPKRVFNADETAFFLNPKGSKVLAPKGDKCIYQQVNSDEKECLTVLVTGNAAGDVVSPMVVFKYERIPKDICLSVPSTWGLGRSESGWMTGETFFEFITNVFNKWLLEKKVNKPVILFIDGHSSHLTLHVSKFCSQNGIILVALYPNATHLIQPMDVAVFRSLKGAWKDAVRQWRIDHIESPILRKVHFCPLLDKVINETLNSSILQNGFRKCGIVPWDKSAVNPPLDTTHTASSRPNNEAAVKDWQNGLAFIEKHLGGDKLRAFQNGSCELNDTSLYDFYCKIVAMHPSGLKQASNLNEQVIENVTTNEDTIVSNMTFNILAIPSTSKEPEIMLGSLVEGTKNTTPLKCNDTKDNIPSPFKKALFWPEQKQKIKKRKTDKVPAVITSKEWQNYYENKEMKKNKLLEEKTKRIEERKRKKLEKENLKNDKIKNKTKKRKVTQPKNLSSSSEEEWVPSGDSIDDILSDKESETDYNFKENINTRDNRENKEKIKEEDLITLDDLVSPRPDKKALKNKTTSVNYITCDQCGCSLLGFKVKCMVCKKWSCSSCANDYQFNDFICKICLGDSQDI